MVRLSRALAPLILAGCASKPDLRPDVVLVIGCTVRFDQTGLAGTLDTTPELMRIAGSGVHFRRAIAAAPWTRPSVAALLTGIPPDQLGLSDPEKGRNNRRIPESARFLSEALSEQGYTTLGVSANPNAGAIFGFDQGFDAYQVLTPPWREGVHKVAGAEVVNTALRAWRGADLRRPAYLQVVLVDTHLPDTSTPAARARFPAETPRISGYRATLADLDAAVGALERGTARGRPRIFAFVADHGEGLRSPEHHGNGHGRNLYPSVVHVPLVVTGEGIPPHQVAEGLVAASDLYGGILHLAGVEAGGWPIPVQPQVYTASWFQGAELGALYAEDRMCWRDYRAMTAACATWSPGLPEGAPLADPALSEALLRAHAAHPGTLRGDDVDVEGALRAQLQGLGYEE